MIISIQIVIAWVLGILQISIFSIIWYELIFLVVFIPYGLQSTWSHLYYLVIMSCLLVD